jgi:hypothetical protein
MFDVLGLVMGAERFDPYLFSQLSGNSNRLKKSRNEILLRRVSAQGIYLK